MLTVADALELDVLRTARAVAGIAGLHNRIQWVHVVGVPDAANWLNGGELVLTTGINMPETDDEQRRYVLALAEKGVAALGVAVGRYLQHAPEAVVEAANECGFPVLEVPFESKFVNIARAINEHISEENMALVRRALTINQVLTQLVLDGGDLRQLATTLAGLINQSISIENERFEALASENIAEVDEARRYTLSQGRTAPHLLQGLEERGILPELRRSLRPIDIPPVPEVGLEQARILAPIVVHNTIYGYVWVIADGKPLSDLDRMAIESGSTIAALMMLYQEVAQSAEASSKGGLLTQLIEGGANRQVVLIDSALRYGVDLRQPYVLLLIESEDRSSQRLLQLYRRVNRLASMYEWAALVGQFSGQLVIVAQAADNLTDIVERVQSQQNGGAALRIGVSAVHDSAESVGEAHQQCREVLHITQRLRDPRPVVYFDDLGYLYPLYRAGRDSLRGNPFVPGLRTLLDEGGADLFHTLETYLDEGANGVQTAERLHIHRSTLNYRLSRISEVFDADLSDPLTRLNLQVAIKLLRLFEVR